VFSSPDTPQQNGVVERKNPTLMDMVRAILEEYTTSDRFWVEAVIMTCYAINRLYFIESSRKHPMNFSPVKKPNVPYFRVFGSNILVKKVETLNFLLQP
jgi:hypothetical protein